MANILKLVKQLVRNNKQLENIVWEHFLGFTRNDLLLHNNEHVELYQNESLNIKNPLLQRLAETLELESLAKNNLNFQQILLVLQQLDELNIDESIAICALIIVKIFQEQKYKNSKNNKVEAKQTTVVIEEDRTDEKYRSLVTFNSVHSDILQPLSGFYTQFIDQELKVMSQCQYYGNLNQLQIIYNIQLDLNQIQDFDLQIKFMLQYIQFSGGIVFQYLKQLLIRTVYNQIVQFLQNKQLNTANNQNSSNILVENTVQSIVYLQSIRDDNKLQYLLERFNFLMQFSSFDPKLTDIKNYLLQNFINFFKNNKVLKADQIHMTISNTFKKQNDYPDYIQQIQKQKLVNYMNHATHEIQIITLEQFEEIKQNQMKMAMKKIIRDNLQFEIQQNEIQADFKSEMTNDIQVQVGFTVEKDYLIQLIEEMKEEVINNLKYNEQDFEHLLKQKGGSLYKFYIDKKSAKQNNTDVQQKQDIKLDKVSSQPELIQNILPEQQQNENQKQELFQIVPQLSEQDLAVQQSALIINENTDSFQQHVLNSTRLDVTGTTRINDNILQIPELSDEILQSAPQLAINIMIQPMYFLCYEFEHSIQCYFYQNNIIYQIQKYIFDFYFCQNSQIINEYLRKEDSFYNNYIEQQTAQISSNNQQISQKYAQTINSLQSLQQKYQQIQIVPKNMNPLVNKLIQQFYPMLNQCFNQLINLCKSLNSLFSIHNQLSCHKYIHMTRRHSKLCSYIFRMYQTIQSQYFLYLYSISVEVAQFLQQVDDLQLENTKIQNQQCDFVQNFVIKFNNLLNISLQIVHASKDSQSLCKSIFLMCQRIEFFINKYVNVEITEENARDIEANSLVDWIDLERTVRSVRSEVDRWFE